MLIGPSKSSKPKLNKKNPTPTSQKGLILKEFNEVNKLPEEFFSQEELTETLKWVDTFLDNIH